MATEDQTVTDVVSLAENAGRELLEANPNLKAAKSMERYSTINTACEAERSNAARLVAQFNEDSSFGDLRDGWLQCGGFGSSLDGAKFPRLLINTVIEGHSAKSLVQEARIFAKSQTSIIEIYTPIAGVTVARAANLGDNIDIIPWADVPDSTPKKMFGPDPELDRAIYFPQRPAYANSAIRIRSPKRKALFSSREDASIVGKTFSKELAAQSMQIQDVMRCSTAISMNVVAELGRWPQFGTKIANDITDSSSYEYGADNLHDAVGMASRNPETLNGKTIAQLFHNLNMFKPSEKKVVRVALDRLNQARRRRNLVDKAIDLGIALEVMLIHDIDENYRGELRYRSSVRGAMFLGGEKSERQKTFNLLKDTYDLRSKAVHSGVLRKKKTEPPPSQVLESAASTCARIVQKLINRGSFPNWEAEYVIGEK